MVMGPGPKAYTLPLQLQASQISWPVKYLGHHLGPLGPGHHKHLAHRRCGWLPGLNQGTVEPAV